MVKCTNCIHYFVCKTLKRKLENSYAETCVAYMNREDLVAVVRCKDCKFGEHSINAIGEPSIACNNPDVGFYEWLLGEDDFCSYGEGKDNA